jgi:hypothetical protein
MATLLRRQTWGAQVFRIAKFQIICKKLFPEQ